MRKASSRGFTLIELVIVVAIVAILAAIALPSFAAQLRKSRRTDAISTMGDVVLNEERWRTNCSAFVDFGGVCPLPSKDPTQFMTKPTSSYYSFTLAGPDGTGAPTATGYQVKATATGDQAKDQQFGTSCTSLTLTHNLDKDTKDPAVCFGK